MGSEAGDLGPRHSVRQRNLNKRKENDHFEEEQGARSVQAPEPR